MSCKSASLFLLSFWIVAKLFASEVSIQLFNGTIWKGTIVSENKSQIVLDVKGRNVYCFRSAIKSIEKDGQTINVSSQQRKTTNSKLPGKTTNNSKSSLKNASYFYVNFASMGLSLATISDEYSSIMEDYYGATLQTLLGNSFSVSPVDKARLTGSGSIGFGYYPRSFFGINTGVSVQGRGDNIRLIKEGAERVDMKLVVTSLDIPLTVRFKKRDNNLAPYIDLGICYSRIFKAEEIMEYTYSPSSGYDDSESEEWLTINLLDELNSQFYNKNHFSLQMSTGIHAAFVFIEYRLNATLTDFANTIDSKLITHSLNFGFDYYFLHKK